jgi:hypothetical protein
VVLQTDSNQILQTTFILGFGAPYSGGGCALLHLFTSGVVQVCSV